MGRANSQGVTTVEITEVRIKLMDEPGERLKAFCSITFDNCFVVRDLKIIDGSNGPFVAMPSRKLTSHCQYCRMKNHLRAPYCNQCGKQQPDSRATKDADGRAKLYADIAHPINSQCREMIQDRVIDEYYEEIELAKLPGYVSRYDEFELEYSESPRAGRPARYDQPHATPTANQPPHVPPSSVPNDPPASKPHFRPQAPPDRSGTGPTPPPAGSFGAGIFPE
jgi:stage V sporulation protein G